MTVILEIILFLIFVLAIIGLLMLIIWSGVSLFCLLSDAAYMWHDIFGGRKK